MILPARVPTLEALPALFFFRFLSKLTLVFNKIFINLATYAAYEALDPLACVFGKKFIQPISKIIETVAIKSSQKKNLKK